MNMPAAEPPRIRDTVITDATSVLANRPVLPGTNHAQLPLFGDPSWDLRPAGKDRHTSGLVIHWSIYPPALANDTKLYIAALLLVVTDAPRVVKARGDVPCINTIVGDLSYLRAFLRWLDDRHVRSFSEVTLGDLNDYLWHVQGLEAETAATKRRRLLAVQRLHCYRETLPRQCRLPDTVLWGGASAAELAEHSFERFAENRTPRIHPDVMEPLLSAALLTAGPIAADLLPTATTLLAYRTIAREVAAPQRHMPQRSVDLWAVDAEQFDRFRQALTTRGLPLPGVIASSGRLEVDRVGLLIAGWIGRQFSPRINPGRDLAGLPLAEDLLRVTRFTAAGNLRPWRSEPADAAEIRRLVRFVITACFLVISYLSGVRTGEALNLQRGCISRDEKLGLVFMSGQQMKASGHRRERTPGTVPWVVTEEVADAVHVLEALTVGTLLFPQGAFCYVRWFTNASAYSRCPTKIRADIGKFITWFNTTIAPATGHPLIPPDDHGRIHPARLRRTLAWHIVRRPGGSTAGARQYGHLHEQITQGYAGAADGGFRDEIAFEKFLLKAEQLHDDRLQIAAGEHISGPAAEDYRGRIHDGAQFAGLTITSPAQANRLQNNPSLNIHHGELLTCVWRQPTAACRQHDDQDRPAWNRCKLSCTNIAWTDRDIAAVNTRIADLEAELADELMPEPLHRRAQERIDRLRAIATAHDSTRPETVTGPDTA